MEKKKKSKQQKYFKKVNKLVKDIDAEIEENNRYRQGRSRKQWEANYMLQNAKLIAILSFCFFALAKLFCESII